jgi:hypothetical protein
MNARMIHPTLHPVVVVEQVDVKILKVLVGKRMVTQGHQISRLPREKLYS